MCMHASFCIRMHVRSPRAYIYMSMNVQRRLYCPYNTYSRSRHALNKLAHEHSCTDVNNTRIRMRRLLHICIQYAHYIYTRTICTCTCTCTYKQAGCDSKTHPHLACLDKSPRAGFPTRNESAMDLYYIAAYQFDVDKQSWILDPASSVFATNEVGPMSL